MDREAWTGFLGAGLLVVAMAAVFVYEAANAPALQREYDVAWITSAAAPMTKQDNLAEGRANTFTFSQGRANLTVVRVSLSWSDMVGDPDTFNVTVAGPGGNWTAAREASAGPLEVTVAVGPPPAATSVNATDPEGAAAANTRTDGMGDWSVTVRLVRAPGTRPVAGQNLEPIADQAQSYTVSFVSEHYEMRIRDA